MNSTSRALWAAGLWATCMSAAAGPEPTSEVQRIEVIGSRIKRVDAETADPVLVVDRAAIERTGLLSVGELLQTLSVHGADLNTTVNNGGDGSTRVDLRNLGSQRTLVLVDGRRWIPMIDGGADLNALPLAMVERIEVLKDGASALYGTDAIAGVVNISTRRDLTSGELRLSHGRYAQGDGERSAMELTQGWVGEHAAISAGLSVVEQDPVYAGDRAISATPTFGLPGNDVNAGASPFTPNGTFGFGGRGTCPYDPNGTYPANGICTSSDGRPPQFNRSTYDPASASYRLFDPRSDGYNFAPENYLQTPQQRSSAFLNTRHTLGSLELSVQALYNQRRSSQQLAPNPVFFGAGLGGSNRLTVPADHVYNPFGQPVTGLSLRPGGQVRRFEQDVDTWRLVLGLAGDLDLAGRYWSWDYTMVRSAQTIDESTVGLLDVSRLRSALGPSFRDANGVPRCGTPATPIVDCVPFDPFRGQSGLSPAMLDDVYFRGLDHTAVRAAYYNLSASGDIIDLPAGPLAMALGFDYRDESAASRLDPRRLAIQNLRDDSYAGTVRAREWFVELQAPLLAQRALAERLELSAAVRRSDYASFGLSHKAEIGLRWQPAGDWLLRASYAEGFRAPLVSELYFPTSDGFAGIADDPCAGMPSAAQLAACIADGVPGGAYQSNAPVYPVLSGGNSHLAAESARSRSLGLVYSPAALPGLDVVIDAYRIRIDNAIAAISPADVLRYCIDADIAEACARTERDADGQLLGVDARMLNSGLLELHGYDASARYQFDTKIGAFAVEWESSYYSRFDIELPRGSGRRSVLGLLQPLEPGFRLRSNLDLSWQHGPWSSSVQLRYYGGLRESCVTAARAGAAALCSDPATPSPQDPSVPLNRLGARVYVDLQLGWEAPWDGRFVLGLRNALDRDPPASYAGTANSFDAAYPVPGRLWYINLSQRW